MHSSVFRNKTRISTLGWNSGLDIDIVAAWISEWYANPFVIPSLDTWGFRHLNTTPAFNPVTSSKFEDSQVFFELIISREPRR